VVVVLAPKALKGVVACPHYRTGMTVQALFRQLKGIFGREE
jgi:hypothetical protein